MSSFSVVVDACALFPAALRDTLLRTAEKGLYRLRWSEQILDELSRNLVESGRMNNNAASHLLERMTATFPEAMVTGHEALIASMTNHPKDRHVVAAAVRCHAQVIVTENLADFQDVALAPFGLEAQHPDHFLSNLLDLEPNRILQGVMEQAADLRRPPRTVIELLDILAQRVPSFASLVRDMLPVPMQEPP